MSDRERDTEEKEGEGETSALEAAGSAEEPSESVEGGIDRSSTLAGAGVSAAVFLGTLFVLGRLGANEAIAVLEGTLPTIRFLSSSAIAATSTVLALMLTLLGLTERTDTRFEPRHFVRIRRVAGLCVIAMIVAIGLLLFMSVPISESEELTPWYELIYWVTFVISAALGGLLVAIVLILRKAVLHVIQVASPHRDSPVTES